MSLNQDVITFRVRFPQFSAVKDGDIAEVFMLADVWLDGTEWSENDFPTARLLWVAHHLALQQQQMPNFLTNEEGTGGSADMFIRSVTIGERTLTLGQRAQFTNRKMAIADLQYGITVYGQMFMQLRDRNFPAVAIV